MHLATPADNVEVLLVSQSTTEPLAEVNANMTVPVGVPALAGIPVTVAVTVAGLPEAAGALTVTVVFDPAWSMSWVNVPVDAVKLPSPE